MYFLIRVAIGMGIYFAAEYYQKGAGVIAVCAILAHQLLYAIPDGFQSADEKAKVIFQVLEEVEARIIHVVGYKDGIKLVNKLKEKIYEIKG